MEERGLQFFVSCWKREKVVDLKGRGIQVAIQGQGQVAQVIRIEAIPIIMETEIAHTIDTS